VSQQSIGRTDDADDVARDPLSTDCGWGRWAVAFWGLVGLSTVAGIAFRFYTRSPLWLDEALSVNISGLPVGDIPAALRHDGHPPLYYFMLHGWMSIFGEGDWAVRALSGLWSVVALPLVWVAGRRLGGSRVAIYALAITAISPFAIRYGTETRMYSMLSVIALVGWLVVTAALERPSRWRLVAIAAVVSVALWTHYWSIWLLGVVGLVLLVRAWSAHRDGRAEDQRSTVLVIAAMVVGALTFVPWLGTMLYQGTHTGTPWARPMRPTEMVQTMLVDFGGGRYAEAAGLGWFIAALAALGLTGVALDRFRIEVDVRTRRPGRPLALLAGGTLVVACLAGYASGATFASRYAALIHPFVILLVALGLDQLKSRPVAISCLSLLVLLGLVGGYRNVVVDRTDARRSADAISEVAEPGDWVVYCPDQLGPSTSRLLGPGLSQVSYPAFAGPARVDWVDYKARLAAASPRRFAQDLLRRAGDHRIFLVFSTSYETHREICPALYNEIGRQRPPQLISDPSDAFEPSAVALFEPSGGGG